jgi:adenylate cyclase
MKGLLEKITKIGPIQITLLVTIVVIVFYAINPSFLNLLELKFYDLRFKSRGAERPGSEIVIVKIDEESIRTIGRWPWSREHWANLIDTLTEWGAKVIGIDAIFAEKESTAADVHLAQAMDGSGSVVVGYFFLTSEEEVRELKEDYTLGEDSGVYPQPFNIVRFISEKAKDFSLLEGRFMRSNIAMISGTAKGLGFFNVDLDVDGTVRWVPLVMRFNDECYPSLALQVLREYHENSKISLKVANYGVERIQLGETVIPTDKWGRFLVNYRGGRNTFPGYPFYKVISDKAEERPPREDFKGKIVLVGATAIGLYDARGTPFEREVPGVEIHATVIDNILRRDFILRPGWVQAVEIPAIILMALIPGLLFLRLSPLRGASISIGLLFIYIFTNWYLFTSQRLWINLVYPILGFCGVFVATTVYQYFTEEREKRKIRNAFQFYVSAGVVDEILKDPGKLKLGGERKVLTVLFSDIKGFSYLSETLPPDTLSKLLNLYLTPMTVTVFKYQGTLDKYMGDAIMAIFGAPLEQNDHAEKACHTAIDMVGALKGLHKRWEIDGIPEISIGIGINTGPMSVGNMGSNMLFDYTVVGDHVNLGSRLEKLNREYGTNIIISEFTHRHIQDKFTCRELDIVRVRGRKEPVTIFELLGREEPFPKWSVFKVSFENGLRAYRSQRWDDGIGEFEKALKIRSEDGPAKLYLKRCMHFGEEGPSPKWDGIQMWD